MTDRRQVLVLTALLALLSGCAALDATDSQSGALDPPPEVIVLALDEQSQKHHQAMRQALSKGELTQAQAHYERIDPVHRYNPEVRVDRAVLARVQGESALAERLYRQVLVIEPGHPVAANDLALMAREQGEMAQSEALLREALQAHPERPRLHFNLAVLYELYLMDLERALEHYQRYEALSGAPDERVSGWIQDLERRVEG